MQTIANAVRAYQVKFRDATLVPTVALPLYLSAVADSELKTCRANMQTIANAVRAYQVKFRDATLVPTVANLVTNGDLHETPQCPKAGTYTVSLSSGAPNVACSVSAHGNYTLGNSS